MRRIALVSDAAYEGGAERYLERLAAGLRARGDAPTLILPDRPELGRLVDRAGSAGFPVRLFRTSGRGPAACGLAVAREIQDLRPDLVHLNFPSPYELNCGLWAFEIGRIGVRHIVATEHIADIPASRRRALLNRVTRRMIDRIITISRQHARLLVERHGIPADRLRVVYNGVEDPGPPAPRPPGFHVVCVGAIEPRKGQDVLIEAFAEVAAREPAARLTLVGEGPSRAGLEGEVIRRGLAGSVVFTGRVESAAGIMATADVVAVPSRIEGLPFVLMEGMAAGAVVVASDLPGLDEVVTRDRTGVLVTPGHASAWREALLALAADPARRMVLASAGRKAWLERFTLEIMIDATRAVYAEVRP